ncbi:PepSY domain-containing protein [Methylotenera sp.]|uniref:PepSY-associated TM helix domain-containing protein n=1 Tax=Methylotenera sp. TaxID=2051956 RepID=UPI00248814A7|nr:PepSY domain-containing protein [Methylotenera sp.]MDI1300099.1 PepSY domain-containing protein [Methylotenera sp.]
MRQAQPTRQWPAYNTIWRWHFYAGLFCIPFVLVLAITGGVYLFKPQVEAALNQPYNQLNIAGLPQIASAQVNAALAAAPNATLNAYELPLTPQSAVQVLVSESGELTRIYVHPKTLQILKIEQEDNKLMQVVHRLHGELLIGSIGSNLVELAASWTIVMLITGLYLWWPRHMKGIAGIVYPRLSKGNVGKNNRLLWRDLHAVTGFWISFFTLFLLLSGLPWAKSWGGLLKEIRHIGTGNVVQQDWTTGRSADINSHRNTIFSKINMVSKADSEHIDHIRHEHMADKVGMHQVMMPQIDYRPLDRLVTTVKSLNLAPPVLISPPSKKSPEWTASSKAQNRPLRADLILDGVSGSVKSRKDFADRPLLDRIIGTGVAIHEGQLFGWFNQLLGLITAIGLVLLSVSAIILWWRRRSPGLLGAPQARTEPSYAPLLVASIILLGVLLPFLGISLIVLLLVERWVLCYIPPAKNFLGLN